MIAFLQFLGAFFLGAAVVVFLLLSFMKQRDADAGVFETLFVLCVTAVPGTLAVMAYWSASQMIA